MHETRGRRGAPNGLGTGFLVLACDVKQDKETFGGLEKIEVWLMCVEFRDGKS